MIYNGEYETSAHAQTAIFSVLTAIQVSLRKNNFFNFLISWHGMALNWRYRNEYCRVTFSENILSPSSTVSLKGYNWSKFEFHSPNGSWDFLKVVGCGVHISDSTPCYKNHVWKKAFTINTYKTNRTFDLIFTKPASRNMSDLVLFPDANR